MSAIYSPAIGSWVAHKIDRTATIVNAVGMARKSLSYM